MTQSIHFSVEETEPLEWGIGNRTLEWKPSEYVKVRAESAEYEGSYEATPSDSEQVFQTEGFSMAHDFIVHPIPSNYGLIQWNGTVITVS